MSNDNFYSDQKRPTVYVVRHPDTVLHMHNAQSASCQDLGVWRGLKSQLEPLEKHWLIACTAGLKAQGLWPQ